MRKLLSRISFIGGIILVFLGVGMVVMKAENSENTEIIKIAMMTLLFITGTSTLLYVIKGGIGNDTD